MSFKFSLQTILEIREKEAQIAQQEFHATQVILNELKKILELERSHYFNDRDALNLAVQNVKFSEIQLYEKSLLIRQNKMMEILKHLRETQKDFQEKNKALMQAKLNKKMIEKLYEIKENDYNKKELKKEQVILDEIAMLGFRKSQIEEENEE